MSGVIDGTIVALREVEAVVEPFDWAFARENAAEIAAHWAAISAGKPAMFNGRIMLQHRAAIADGVFRAGYFETDYAAFMTWRDRGHPGVVVRNGYAMAALRAADGAFLCGKMGGHTANAGKVYFAAGTPDREDVTPDGRLDLAGSVTRELCEETGLTLDEIAVGAGWTAVILPGRVAFMRPVALEWEAEEARALMLSRIAGQAEPELDDIVVIRTLADCEGLDMPPFMQLYLAHIFGDDRSLMSPGSVIPAAAKRSTGIRRKAHSPAMDFRICAAEPVLGPAKGRTRGRLVRNDGIGSGPVF